MMCCPIHFGIAGWSYADWKDTVYPPGKHDQLAYISRFVDCIEINSTFYRPPSARNSASWLARTETLPDFFFTAKLHQDITHRAKLDPATIRQFHDGFAPLLQADRLRTLLAQFRYDFADTPATRRHVSAIVDNFADAFNLTVEVRHRSWQAPDALSFLQDLGVNVCNLDYPTSSNSFDTQTRAIGPHAYFRLHGRNTRAWFSKASRDQTYDYFYNDRELAQITTRIDTLAAASQSLTVIANNHYRGAEVATALQLKNLTTNQKLPIPDPLLATYPALAQIATSG